jgi:hypothetical protein
VEVLGGGFWYLGGFGYVGEERKRRGLYGAGESGGEKVKSDLKRGHVNAHNACDRSYIRAFDHIHAECVCVVGLCAQTNASEFERRPVFAIERTGYVRTHACMSVCVIWGSALEQTQVS